jgi:4-amino-4-deoxy-L-arabinose transferase-like glycosyltransferase
VEIRMSEVTVPASLPSAGDGVRRRHVVVEGAGEDVEDSAAVVPRWAEWGTLAGAAVWITLVTFVRWPVFLYSSISSDSSIDAAFFAYAGELVRQGGTPYVTFWDHKPPLIFLVHAAALSLSGGAAWGLWAVGLLALLSALGLAYLVLRRSFGTLPALLGAVFLAAALPSLFTIIMTEGYAPPLQWMAVLVLLWWRRGAGPLPAGLALGAIAALAALFRPNLIGAQVAVALAIAGLLVARRRPGELIRFVGGGVAGVLAVLGPMLGYLQLHGAVGAFHDQVIHYNALYTEVSWKRRIRSAFFGTRYAGIGIFLLPASAWLLAVLRLARDRTARLDPVLLLAAIWLPIEAVFAGMSGRPYGHYFMTLIAPLAFLLAWLGSLLLGWTDVSWRHAAALPRPPQPRALVVALAVAIALPAVADVAAPLRDTGIRHERADQVRAIVAYLDTHTRPGDPILVWGHAADIYFFSGHPPASRFVYPLPLLDPRYGTPEMIAGYLDEVRASRPPIIIDATGKISAADALVPSLGAWDPAWKVPPDSVSRNQVWWSMPPAMRQFYDYVASNYAVTDSVGPYRWAVYRRRPVPVEARAPEAKPLSASR